MHHTFGPHASWRTCLQAKWLWLQPWNWQNGKQTEQLRKALEDRWHMQCSLFATGRESLLALLKAMNLQTGEEVLIQGYTCAVVANAIHAAGGVPIYADIDRDTLNLNPTDVAKKITHRTRAVICQHTFGIPADAKVLRSICDEHNILLIEDCAHVIPDEESTIGMYGDAMFFSFGRDKAISGISGGAVLVRKSEIGNRKSEIEKRAAHLPLFTIGRLLLYPCWYVLARPLYTLGIGKVILVLARKLGLLLPYVTHAEKAGEMSPTLHKLPNACAALAFTQLNKLSKINGHRRALTMLYLQAAKKNNWHYPKGITEDMPLQKFPIFVAKADELRAKLKQQHIYLEDGWSGAVVCPRSSNQQAANYQIGDCPVAEKSGKTIVNLPTHPGMSNANARAMIRLLLTLSK